MDRAENHADYYRRRAEEEIARAQASVDPRIVSLHYEVAELLLQRMSELDAGKAVRPVEDRETTRKPSAGVPEEGD